MANAKKCQWKRVKSGFKNPKPSVKKCAKCGHRIRGANHENGGHHNGGVGFKKGA